MAKILLKGFYGFGNFGDDILMITTYRIIKEVFPEAEILVGSESKNPDYIHTYLEGVKIVNSTANLEVDWIIHGGGGVFFDFTNHSTKYIFLNQFIEFIGYRTYRNLYQTFRKLRGHGIVNQKGRVGFGIGVGTYTPSSNRFFSDILALSSFDILFVRDDASVLNAKKYISSESIYKSSDLAFLFHHWMPAQIKKTAEPASIGFILRDWAFNSHVAVVLEVAKTLQAQGHRVRFFALDEDSDAKFIQSANAISPVYCWKPTEMTVAGFLSELSACKLIISSRAHGAIVAACLGIPVCCVCIEPKLHQIAAMLNTSARPIREPFTTENILNKITDTLEELPLLKAATSQDVLRNNEEIEAGISLFKNFISTHKQS
jgi:polysaccharide pyruvyl transferase WcaK-like protein